MVLIYGNEKEPKPEAVQATSSKAIPSVVSCVCDRHMIERRRREE
jgi:hypothetical protein